ncbi:MAG TPA: hemerythrin domain-containing protein [Candidatus Limnocylindria bacterium]|nr:hemerythrin domain-containing protein [Candidatus Limnocylindria bacterium]
MPRKIHRYLADDHRRLDGMLERAISDPENIEMSAYAQFRSGLLKHISVEEKILLPAAQRIRGGEPLPVAAKLRLDHGALVALLVPSPTPRVIAAIRAILTAHNPIEENPGGIYDQCEELAGAEADQILRQLQAAPEVKVLPHVDSAFVMEAARRALARAGYQLDL